MTSLAWADFVNVPPGYSLESLHKMVAENGGTFSMNLNNSVTHRVAAESKGIKFQAAKVHGDVIHYTWVLDCCAQKKLLPLQPKYFLFLSDASRKKLTEEIDEFSDSYYWDVDLGDIKQLLSNITASEDANTIDYMKKKYCPKDEWCRFHSCCIYFFVSKQFLKPDWESLLGLALRRLKLAVLMGGGKVTSNLAQATHLVVLMVPGSAVDFNSLVKSLTAAEKHVLQQRRLHVIGSQWLEDSLQVEQKLQEDTYSLQRSGLEELEIFESKTDVDMEAAPSATDGATKQMLPILPLSDDGVTQKRGEKVLLEGSKTLSSPQRGGKRKRGRPASGSTKKGKSNVSQSRTTRAKVVKRPAKICEDKSDETGSSDDRMNEGGETVEQDRGVCGMACKENSELQETQMAKQKGKAAEEEVSAEDRIEEAFIKPPGFEIGRSNGQQEWTGQAPDIEMSERRSNQEIEKPGKLEVTVDPVHAMLVDMIPSLGMKKAEILRPTPDNENPDIIPKSEPVKKKKVSYKDVASELLKS